MGNPQAAAVHRADRIDGGRIAPAGAPSAAVEGRPHRFAGGDVEGRPTAAAPLPPPREQLARGVSGLETETRGPPAEEATEARGPPALEAMEVRGAPPAMTAAPAARHLSPALMEARGPGIVSKRPGEQFTTSGRDWWGGDEEVVWWGRIRVSRRGEGARSPFERGVLSHIGRGSTSPGLARRSASRSAAVVSPSLLGPR